MGKDILELGCMLIILVFIISGVQWFLVRYTHWSIALAATGFISLVVSSVFRWKFGETASNKSEKISFDNIKTGGQ